MFLAETLNLLRFRMCFEEIFWAYNELMVDSRICKFCEMLETSNIYLKAVCIFLRVRTHALAPTLARLAYSFRYQVCESNSRSLVSINFTSSRRPVLGVSRPLPLDLPVSRGFSLFLPPRQSPLAFLLLSPGCIRVTPSCATRESTCACWGATEGPNNSEG